jgi:hypothetical protein
LQNNRTGLALTFLGTGGVLSGAGGRCAPGLALNRVKDVWMVDAGEDVQRQMMWVEHLRPSKVSGWVVVGGGGVEVEEEEGGGPRECMDVVLH